MKLYLKWGFLPVALSIISLILLAASLILLFFQSSPIGFFLLIPVIGLNIYLLPVMRTLFTKRKPTVEIDESTISLEGETFLWKDVKSISYTTGKKANALDFTSDSFPAIQRLFILDMNGAEVSAIVDIDYSFKKDRKNNALLLIIKELVAMKKDNLISDWAYT
ncbi:MAG: hypothetical protein HGA85_03650 [Nanoarchaeota archaeon]|nr:hypothetical protein [Nanoarchaeota archaeon]